MSNRCDMGWDGIRALMGNNFIFAKQFKTMHFTNCRSHSSQWWKCVSIQSRNRETEAKQYPDGKPPTTSSAVPSRRSWSRYSSVHLDDFCGPLFSSLFCYYYWWKKMLLFSNVHIKSNQILRSMLLLLPYSKAGQMASVCPAHRDSALAGSHSLSLWPISSIPGCRKSLLSIPSIAISWECGNCTALSGNTFIIAKAFFCFRSWNIYNFFPLPASSVKYAIISNKVSATGVHCAEMSNKQWCLHWVPSCSSANFDQSMVLVATLTELIVQTSNVISRGLKDLDIC